MAVKTLAGLAAGPKAKLVMVEAVKRGSHTSGAGIIHVDPSKKAHPRAQKRALPVDIARAMEAKGLVKITKSRVSSDDAAGFDFRAKGDADRVSLNAGDEDHPFLNSGGSTRDTTAFRKAPLLNQGQREIEEAAEDGRGGPGSYSDGDRAQQGDDEDDGEGEGEGGEDAGDDDEGGDAGGAGGAPDDSGEGEGEGGAPTPPAKPERKPRQPAKRGRRAGGPGGNGGR